MHPDLLPTAADLDDPLGFRADATAPDTMSEEDFDAGLRKLLGGEDSTGDTEDGAGSDGASDGDSDGDSDGE
ncbi:MAG: hypothetical protein VX747_10800, partial [Actinomycetota bacterium]|nr:hypothetical protein [Actinomycetota bacterium]